MKPLVVMGLLFLSAFFVFFNWRCILSEERKKASVMVRLFLVSPVIYLFLVQTAFALAVQTIAWDFDQNADGTKAMVAGLIFMACSLAFLVPFLKGYSKLVGKPFELCYFIYCMFAIMHMDAISLSSRTYLYFIVIIVFVLIWYFLFRNDLRELASRTDGKRIARINMVLSLAFVVNLLMESGAVFRLFFSKESFVFRFLSVYQVILSVMMYLFMLALFSSIFSLVRESKAHEKAQLEAKTFEREALASQSEVARALASIIDNKSGETGNHVKRVGEYARVIGRGMGMDERTCETLATAAMLHDVGKLMVPNSILEKPGKLTEDEYQVVKQHVVYGERLLKDAPGKVMQMAAIIAKEHHERWDGKGYVLGLKGDEIHVESQIVSVADVYDAITGRRSYHDPQDSQFAKSEIVRNSGTQFSPRVVDAFISRYGEIKAIHDQFPDER